MATHLARTCDDTAGGGYSNKWTWSGWVKRAKLGAEQGIMGNQRSDNNTNSRFKLYFRSTDKLGWECKDSGGSDDNSFETNMLFRDTNAWYHIVFIYDSDNSTETDRMKCYVNGKDVRTELGGFSSINEVGSGFGTLWSSSVVNYLGTSGNNSGIAMQFEGCMSHCHLTYGQRYEASTFGSFDSTTGEWKINISPSVTYGSQGYFLLKDNASVTDQSGEGNNYTATGTLTKTEDCPSNVFCTMNPLSHRKSSYVHSHGNNTWNGSTVTDWKSGVAGTLGAKSGKYYWEIKWTAGDTYSILGVLPVDHYWRCAKGDTGTDIYNYINGNQFDVTGTGNLYNYQTTDGTDPQRTLNDIFMYAIDMDNRKMWIGENGVWDGSGNPATGANPTWDTALFGSDWDNGFVPFCQGYKISAETEFKFNFGNGYFGTDAVSSAGTNASGFGIFEYDVPSGFTALCTKGINSF